MKTTKRYLQFYACFLLCVVTASAGVKEVKNSQVTLTRESSDRTGFHFKTTFQLPELPSEARLTKVLLIVDQRFEQKDALDSTIVPRGLVNRNARPVEFLAFGFDGKDNPEVRDWRRIDSSMALSVNPSLLLPEPVIQSERNRGRRENEAISFDVTHFVREQRKVKNEDVIFLFSANVRDGVAAEMSQLEIDATKLAARLVLIYAEPPVAPSWHK